MRWRRYNRGHWLLERERHRLTEEYPPDAGAEVPLADVIAAWTRRLSRPESVWLRDLEAIWPELVGAAVAGHSRPGRFEGRVLTVYVDHSVWLSELARYGQREMLPKLRKRFPSQGVAGIRFQMDPDAGRGERDARPGVKAEEHPG